MTKCERKWIVRYVPDSTIPINVNASNERCVQPSMLVVSDVDEVFVPIVDGLLLPLSQVRAERVEDAGRSELMFGTAN